MSEWRYALYDLLSSRLLVEHMPFSIESYTWMLGEPGTLSATLPLGDEGIRIKQPRDVIAPRRTALVLFRDEQPMWDGIVWTRRRQRAGNANALTIGAKETRSYFDHRYFRPELGYGSAKTKAYTNVDAFTIFRELLADAQELTIHGRQPGNLGIEPGDGLSGVLVSRRDDGTELGAYHGYSWATHAQLFEDLAADDPGLEWRIDPYLSTDRELRRRLVLGSPKIGTPPHNPNMVTFEYPGSITDYEWSDDGERSANYVAELGAEEGDAMRWADGYHWPQIEAGYPLLEATVSRKSDSALGVLQGRVACDLALMDGDITVPSISIVGYPVGVAPGDHVRVRISDPDWWPGSDRTPHEQVVRVIGLRVTPGPRERTQLLIEEPRTIS